MRGPRNISRPVVVIALAVLLVCLVLMVRADGNGGHPPAAVATTEAPPSFSTLPATSTTLAPTAKTTKRPDVFTTGTVPGPVQVRVVGEPRCHGYAGQGWEVDYQITNSGPTRSGQVGSQVDNSGLLAVADVASGDPLEPLTLGPGRREFRGTGLVGGFGEGLTIIWDSVSSFPVEAPTCPEDPAAERAARQATTTT